SSGRVRSASSEARARQPTPLARRGAQPAARSRSWIRLTRLAQEPALSIAPLEQHVDVGVDDVLLARARADLEVGGGACASVDELMPVGLVRWKAGGHAGREQLLARVRDEGQLALKDIDELVLHAVPVPER